MEHESNNAMTWVIAATPRFGGYAILHSDIAVQTADGRELNILQKAYPIANFFAAGFAGFVFIGFHLLESLRQYCDVPPSTPDSIIAVDPVEALNEWAPIAKEVYDQCPDEERRSGAQLLVAGVHPVKNCEWMDNAAACIARTAAPDFKVGATWELLRVISIVTGARHYRAGVPPTITSRWR